MQQRMMSAKCFYGYSTYETIMGNKVAPGYLDKYLAETGYAGQQTNEPKKRRSSK